MAIYPFLAGKGNSVFLTPLQGQAASGYQKNLHTSLRSGSIFSLNLAMPKHYLFMPVRNGHKAMKLYCGLLSNY